MFYPNPAEQFFANPDLFKVIDILWGSELTTLYKKHTD
jgi:hypothetical protein